MRAIWILAALPGALALILCFVPLFDVLGYAHSFALGLICPISAGIIGLRSGHDGLTSLGRALRDAALHLALALAIISINALRVRNCNYLMGLGFFALLPLASSLYAAALAVALAHVGARWTPRLRHAAFAALLAGSFIMSVWSLYKEPPIFAFNHLYGYFAGSIYDEVITIDTRLLAFRLFTLLRVMAIAIGIVVLATKGLSQRTALLCGLALTVLGAERLLGERLDFRSSRARILTELSRPLTLPGLVIHLPPHLDEEARREIGRDHAFRLWQLARELGVEEQPVIESFVYASPAQKARLLGAKDTMFAKPWRREIHIDYAPTPHPLLKHELAHVVAASFARPPLRVSSRFGVLVNMALVEGLAEAVSPARGDFDLDTQARVLKELGLAPDLRQILGARGFWAAAPARAYTQAGSFVRFLINRYGNEKIKGVYASGGNFAAVYGKEIDALIKEWELMIAALPVAPESLDQGRARFATPSIFARTCGHEVATLRATARHAPPGEAVAIYRRIAELERHSTASKTELALGLLRAQADEELLALSAELLADDELSAADRYRLRQARAELFWQKDEPHLARVELLAGRSEASSTAVRRLEWVRLWALAEPLTTGRAVRDFLTQGPSTKSIVALLEAYAKTPKDKTLPYLIGRHLAQGEACKEASSYLEAAAPHPSPLIEAERLRLHATCLLQQGELERGRAELLRYLELAKTSGERERARDLLQYAEWLATE